MDLSQSYQQFLDRKAQLGSESGFTPRWMPDFLFDFQVSLTEWAVRIGRGALFADCGLGKTPMELVWAQNVVEHTNRPVLILTPLAVAGQTVREAEKFDMECTRTAGGSPERAGIYVTNYEKLHHFDPADFAGVVCDESSAIKAFDGKRRAAVTEFLRTVPYRLLATATAAPNDYIELGTASEALGVMGQADMLGRFFRNDQNNTATNRSYGSTARWRFKGHAEQPFWRWVCSWARACRRPSDLGFDDDRFVLPGLEEREHIVETRTLAPGMLFPAPATNMREEREERRRTIPERCEMAAELVNPTGEPATVWCHLNAEGDLLEQLIPDARQIKGTTPDEEREEIWEAFTSGSLRVVIVKPRIGAWGLNLQNCAHTVTFASHSYEQYYQAVRRHWRFGQARPVVVDLVATEGERGARENMRRKSEAADRMFTELVAHMGEAMRIDSSQHFNRETEIPSWLSSIR